MASQSLHASFSGELFGLVIIPRGPASSRTIRLTRKVCSRPGGSHQGSGAVPRTSPVVQSHPLASTQKAAEPMPRDRFFVPAHAPAARVLAESRLAWRCQAFYVLILHHSLLLILSHHPAPHVVLKRSAIDNWSSKPAPNLTVPRARLRWPFQPAGHGRKGNPPGRYLPTRPVAHRSSPYPRRLP